MKPAYCVADVRATEVRLMAQLPEGALMQRAAVGLAVESARILQQGRGKVTGARVVLLVGAGDNGGDALWAGAWLAHRGASVTAITLASRWHAEGARALTKAGGRLEPVSEARDCELIARADLVLDGIVGIGGSGALRGSAIELADAARESQAITIAVDLPSGIDADSGAVADPNRVITADVTVTFGVLKPGLVIAPGSLQVGELLLVDIGLDAVLREPPALHIVEQKDAAAQLLRPGPTDDKYTRGVVGVVSGSKPYPGAGVLSTGSARLGGAGMVRYAGGAPEQVIAHWPEVVIAHDGPAKAGKVQAWVVGPGAGTDDGALGRLAEVLAADVPVLIDADALTLLAAHDELRILVSQRWARGQITVLTPHAGEFARLGYQLPAGAAEDHVAVVKSAALELGAVVLLKGAHTIVAEPDGTVFVNTRSASALATAGSGDVLSGLAGSMLAAAAAASGRDGHQLTSRQVGEVVASAAFVHGLAGQLASRHGLERARIGVAGSQVLASQFAALSFACAPKSARRSSALPPGRHHPLTNPPTYPRALLPVTAQDVLAAVPSAIAAIRCQSVGDDFE